MQGDVDIGGWQRVFEAQFNEEEVWAFVEEAGEGFVEDEFFSGRVWGREDIADGEVFLWVTRGEFFKETIPNFRGGECGACEDGDSSGLTRLNFLNDARRSEGGFWGGIRRFGGDCCRGEKAEER